MDENKTCKVCKESLPIDDFHRRSKAKDGRANTCKWCVAAKRLEVRRAVLAHYSGGGKAKCACCGEEEIRFLTIDHINGGGRRHKQEIKKKGYSLMRWLQKQGYPDGFRCLCMNCNVSYGWYGFCPHQKEGKA